MVMGPTHAMSGAAVWLAGATLAGTTVASFTTDSLPVLLMGTVITAGAALGPDIDSHSSTIVNSFGAAGKAAHAGVNTMSVAVYDATKTRKDQNRNNGHRTLFHTPLMAIVLGVLVALGSSMGGSMEIAGHAYSYGQIFSLVTMFIFLHIALAGLFEKQIKNARRKYGPYIMMLVSAVITFVTAAFLPENGTYAWLGFSVGLGWFMHLMGDAITKMGVPLLFPIKFHGKRWWDVTLPSFMRIKAGGTFEYVVLLPLLTVLTVALLLWNVPTTHDIVANLLPS